MHEVAHDAKIVHDVFLFHVRGGHGRDHDGTMSDAAAVVVEELNYTHETECFGDNEVEIEVEDEVNVKKALRFGMELVFERGDYVIDAIDAIGVAGEVDVTGVPDAADEIDAIGAVGVTGVEDTEDAENVVGSANVRHVEYAESAEIVKHVD